MDVLRALEETAWHIKPEEILETRRKENWKFWQDADPKAFNDNCDISDETYFRLTNNGHRVKEMVKILRVLLSTALDIQRQFETSIRRRPKPIITKQSKGITSLPDEILSQIFIFCVSSCLSEGRQAVRLSHVSRYFRAIAVAETRLWSTIQFGAHMDEIDAFLARSGQNSDLHIVICAGSCSSTTKSFIEKCWPVASRWKTLTVTEQIEEIRPFDALAFAKADDLLKLVDGHRRLHLDRLQELRVIDHRTSDPWIDTGTTDERFMPLWTSPKLHNLHFKDYVPSPAPTFASVTSFTLSIRIFRYSFDRRMARLLSFLAATPSIKEFILSIEHDESTRAGTAEGLQSQIASCPSITSLSLRFSQFGIRQRAIQFVSTFTNSFKTPNLEQLSISIGFWYTDMMSPNLGGYAGYDLLLDLSNALLPTGGHAHSQLTSLTYDFELENSSSSPLNLEDVTREISVRRRTFSIPLDRIPNLSSLKLKTFTQVCFRRDGPFVACRLRDLHLSECNAMTGESLQEVVESLKNAGVWDTVESVTVKDCKKLQYETALDAVGAERLHFLNS